MQVRARARLRVQSISQPPLQRALESAVTDQGQRREDGEVSKQPRNRQHEIERTARRAQAERDQHHQREVQQVGRISQISDRSQPGTQRAATRLEQCDTSMFSSFAVVLGSLKLADPVTTIGSSDSGSTNMNFR